MSVDRVHQALHAFAAVSIPTGSFGLLLALAITGGSPGVPVVHAEPAADMDRSAVFVLPPMAPEGEPDVAPPPSEPSAPEPPAPLETAQVHVPQPDAPAPIQSAAPPRFVPKAGLAVTKRPRPEAAPAAPAKPTGRKGRPCVEPIDGITQLAPGSYAVDKDVLDHFTDSKNAQGLGSAFWHETASGEVDGVVVRRIRCGSPLHQAGLRNGDVVHAINGRALTSWPAALRVWSQVKRRDVVKVRVSHKDGSAQVLRYRVD